jgi:hypothetical protein
VEAELLELCEKLGGSYMRVVADGDRQADDLTAAAVRKRMEPGAGARGAHVRREAVLVMERVYAVDYLRQMARRECAWHEWRRRRDPTEVEKGEDYDMCPECVRGCSCSEEEWSALTRGEVACGNYGDEEARNMVEWYGKGVCCGGRKHSCT